jgi:hypothetical protein
MAEQKSKAGFIFKEGAQFTKNWKKPKPPNHHRMAEQKSKAGFIFKEGAQFTKNWKKRYLVIERDRIAYYTKENKREKKRRVIN